jgi:hypothetical protein
MASTKATANFEDGKAYFNRCMIQYSFGRESSDRAVLRRPAMGIEHRSQQLFPFAIHQK